MGYGLYRDGKGGTIRKIRGKPSSPTNQRNMVVWSPTRKGVKSWIGEWGTKTQKEKHLSKQKMKSRKKTRRKKPSSNFFDFDFGF